MELPSPREAPPIEVPYRAISLIVYDVEKDKETLLGWREAFLAPTGPRPDHTPLLRCPDGHRTTLRMYGIDAEGMVAPEFRCSCGWKGKLKLLGWCYGRVGPA